MGQIDDFVHEIARKSCFFEDTNMDHPLWRGLAIQKSEVSSFWRLPLKNMGNILRSDLWAGSVALRLSDSQHLISTAFSGAIVVGLSEIAVPSSPSDI